MVSIQQHNSTILLSPSTMEYELIFIGLKWIGWLRYWWVRWLQDPTKRDLDLNQSQASRDKVRHEALVLESSRNPLFHFLPRASLIPLYDRAVMCRNRSNNIG